MQMASRWVVDLARIDRLLLFVAGLGRYSNHSYEFKYYVRLPIPDFYRTTWVQFSQDVWWYKYLIFSAFGAVQTPYIKASELFRMYQSFKRDNGLLCGDHENASQLGKWLAGIKETKDFLIEKRPGNVKHYAFHLAKLKKNYNVVLENDIKSLNL